MTPDAFASLVTNIGLAGSLAVFFVWQSAKREEKWNTRIMQLEDFQKTTLLQLCTRNAELLGRNQDVLERCVVTMDRWERHLDRIERAASGN